MSNDYGKITGRIYDTNLVALTGEFNIFSSYSNQTDNSKRFNKISSTYDHDIALVGLLDNNFVVLHADDADEINGRIFSSNGEYTGGNFTIISIGE